MKVCSLVHLLILFGLSLGANPGVKVRITQKGLEFGQQVGIEFLKQKLKEEIFEDWIWNGQEKFGLGNINYTLSRVKIENIEFPNASVSFIPGTGINLMFEHSTAIVSADWKIRTWLFKNSGTAAVNISGVFIKAVATIRHNETGQPSLLLESCQTSIDGLNIKLDETTSWLYKYFVTFLETPIRDTLNKNLCPNIKEEIERINAEFIQRQVQTQIDPFVRVDYSLVNTPAIFETYINLDLKGTVYPAENDTFPPFKPASFLLPDKNDSMLYIGVSEYFFHSVSLAYFTSGAFNVSTEEELSSYFRLTTDHFGSILPMVAHRYPESHPVMLNLMATAAPVITLRPGSFILEIAGSMEVMAVLPNSTAQPMFTLNLTASTHASLTIFRQKLMSALCLDSLQLFMAHSSIGFFRVSRLENFLSYVLQNGVIPAVNAKLKEGFPLPNLDRITLEDSRVKVCQGFLLISTEVSYKF